MCGSCGQRYSQGYTWPLTTTVTRGKGNTKGVIKSPARLKAEQEKAEAKAKKALASVSSDPLTNPVAGTSGPATPQLERPDEK